MENTPIVHIIDDDLSVREAIALVLSSEGYRIKTYASAHAFLAAIAWSAEGCVITDVDMPGMTGLELLGQIVDRRLSLPVIVITGNASAKLAALAKTNGAVDFLEKPFSVACLLFAVARALTPSDGHTGLAA